VYVAGGESASAVSAAFFSLDIESTASGWKELAPLPKPVSHSVLAAVTEPKANKIFLAGGRKKNDNGVSDLYTDVVAYDIATNIWHAKAALPYPLCAGTGLFFDTENLLMFGGDKGTVFHVVELLLAAISVETDSIKKQTLIQKKNKLQSTHPGFSKELLQYNIKTDRWKRIGTIPFAVPVTTTAVKNKNIVYLPSGEIKAGVRSTDILSVTFLPKTK
jgi:N-acetylneuraminic acid mutarotase